MNTNLSIIERLRSAINRKRLIDTAVKLISVPSRTGEAGAVADCLAAMLAEEGFEVERMDGGHAQAPAVVVRFGSGKPGRTLQFDGHIDTVHLPFVAPEVHGDRITGSGACDMKSGVAVAVEALRVIRQTEVLEGGSLLLTAHDLHEAPWGLGQQLDTLIRQGVRGDGVLIPEPKYDCLPIRGRGSATWKVWIRRQGEPVHEVLRPANEPSVIAAGAAMIRGLQEMESRLCKNVDDVAGAESVFVGQIHSGEIYNQYPQECWLEGTRRWLPGTVPGDVEREFRSFLDDLARQTHTDVAVDYRLIRDAFYLDQNDALVSSFQEACEAVSGQPLPAGPKLFVDDGNSFFGLARVPAVTHGPLSGGPHTVHEWVSIQDMERVVLVYALTAAGYCNEIAA